MVNRLNRELEESRKYSNAPTESPVPYTSAKLTDYVNWHVYDAAGGPAMYAEEEQNGIIVRRYVAHFTSTPDKLNSATMKWKLDSSNFQSMSRPGTVPKDHEYTVKAGNVETVLQRNVYVISEHNPWGVPLGYNIPYARGNYMGQAPGQRFSYISAPHANNSDMKHCVHRTAYSLASDYIKKHGTRVNEKTLLEGVMSLDGTDDGIMNWKHPIAEYLETAFNLPRSNIYDKNEGYGIQHHTVNGGHDVGAAESVKMCVYNMKDIKKCARYILESVLGGTQVANYSDYTVTAQRADLVNQSGMENADSDFTNFTPMMNVSTGMTSSNIGDHREAHSTLFQSTPQTASLGIEVHYVFP